MRHSTGRPTVVQARRLALLALLPCWCCWPLRQPNRTEIHHLVDRGYRIHSGGHDATLPLCSWHHRGVPPPRMPVSRAEDIYGPSLALMKRRFVMRYGMERDILSKVNAALELDEAAFAADRFLWPGWQCLVRARDVAQSGSKIVRLF